ncbi:MAG: single-stranded-DNA-specific exonuclease RecJ [Legionellaceae bacterium]|nr:single-stranded-DNA-specific exonuclease RecJ [Legionellaceae bacterium]
MQIHQKQVPESIELIADINPVLQRVYALRNITDASQLDNSLQSLLSYKDLTDIDKACLRLEQALRNQEKILVIGDFDADGATSVTLAIRALKVFGALNVEYLVPNRFEYGYGLTPDIVEVAKTMQPDLIITVDNGISSIAGVAKANEYNIDVLVTDHHLPGDTLPLAHAIVNPNQKGDKFSSKSIAGVGVIFYIMLALRRHLANGDWFESNGLPIPNMSQFLDLVALGTVADVVALDQNNRILVNQGLIRVRRGLARPGILALLEIAKREAKTLQASDLGFAIGPRLNAAGRLDDMSLGIECLLSDDLAKARILASKLDSLNIERRKIETEMKEQAQFALKKVSLDANSQLPVAICLVDPAWHQGVIGILAGRLKERHNRPTIIFAVVDDKELKGSARSVPGLNIRDVLAAIDKDNPGLIGKFGGHAMAAGLSLPISSFEKFHKSFVSEVEKHLDVSQCSGDVFSDGSLGEQDLNIDLALLIQDAGPWGSYFPEPKFDNVFEILDQRIVGKNHLKLTLALAEGGEPIDAIMFNVDLDSWPNHRTSHVHAMYRLDINTYQGRTKLQLMVEAMLVAKSVVT